ncbi:TPA: sugar phosphate isomerase/epimerase [Candidatus Sumerlaeota bacterium]|jgi:3-dehydroshikimate dehydratase|nr:sugar phosphate isomerase/epimerase [Candidatus Sumerlaeota bacterium]
MLKTGLCSVTFRNLSPQEIIQLAAKAGINGIEWGGDLHVPYGNLELADEVRQQTLDAGLQVSSYGSYYRVGGESPEIVFEDVVETAQTLGAPVVRVWAGKQASAVASEEHRAKVVEDARRICDIAAKANVRIAFEYHNNSLTDTAESAVRLFQAINHENLRSYWQPPEGMNYENCLDGLHLVSPWLSHVHVFQWTVENGKVIRHALSHGADRWRAYLAEAGAVKKEAGERYAILEFVLGDSTAAFLEDAKTLHALLKG